MIDVTSILVAVIGGILSVLSTVLVAQINTRMGDKAAAAVLETSLQNSLGALHQAAVGAIEQAKPKVAIPGVSPRLTVGVQYVLDHAGAEAAHFGLTPEAIADKINARIGVASIAINLAAVGSGQSAPAPLAVPVAPLIVPDFLKGKSRV